MTFDEDKAAYVIVTMQGPFGPIRQVSERMRLSEAVMTAGQCLSAKRDANIKEIAWSVIDVEVVQLSEDN